MNCPQCGIELQPNSNVCPKCGSNPIVQNNPQQPTGYYAVSKKNKILGIILIIAPFAGLFFIMISYAIAQFIFSAMMAASQ
jgi:hypothetical protein